MILIRSACPKLFVPFHPAGMEGKEVWPHQDSNLNLEFRKLLFYPLNYGAFELIAKLL
jgi:hypothetical protein